ncbi:hypothetical protein GCM10028833_36420 [Glycomyces tarimensis]
MDGDFDHARDQVVLEGHRIAVASGDQSPGRLGPAPLDDRPPGAGERGGHDGTAGLRPLDGLADPVPVHLGLEPRIGPVVAGRRDGRFDRRRGVEHPLQAADGPGDVRQQLGAVPRIAPRRRGPLLGVQAGGGRRQTLGLGAQRGQGGMIGHGRILCCMP